MAVAMYQPLGNGPVAPIGATQPMQPNVIVTNQAMIGQPAQPQYVQPQMQMQTQPIPQPLPMMMLQPQQPVRNVVVQQPQQAQNMNVQPVPSAPRAPSEGNMYTQY